MTVSGNEKRATTEYKKGEKIYIPIGYPLRYVASEGKPHPTDDKLIVRPLQYYSAELCASGKFITKKMALPDEFFLWSRCLHLHDEGIKNACNMKCVETLKEKGLIIVSDTFGEALEKMYPLKIVRQGLGWTNENKYCIRLGNELICPTTLQNIVWLSAGLDNVKKAFISVIFRGK